MDKEQTGIKMKKTNIQLQSLIEEMKKTSSEEQANLWRRVAGDLEKPTRGKRVVNLSRLNRFTKENEVVVVPGKVLGTGDLAHKLTVAAYSFSESAKEKINSNGKAITLKELLQSNPKGKKVRIIG
ncbi:MAG: 50S ribosomal protein L18e [Nanoarchaeota archaeon]